ncbi:hypothetical protein [Novilysobacter selenitireducens]|uniref:Uncharacterized protein n=1 Tax=Novilysobacter selenitireducens TaxID=2872639 RepID=A0ABS7T451_9GAMM|nr:hypothetical protein [Lysobacter selenitireducens]MBZ4038647.1 hypothetical protein [Lysobacter selenitireducens]
MGELQLLSARNTERKYGNGSDGNYGEDNDGNPRDCFASATGLKVLRSAEELKHRDFL